MFPWPAVGSALPPAQALTGCQPQQHGSCRCSKASSRGWSGVLRTSTKCPWCFAFYSLDPKYFFLFFPESLASWPDHNHVSVAHIHCSTAIALILLLQRTPRAAWEAHGIFLQDTAFAACSQTHWFVPSSVAVSCTATNRHH